LSPPNPPLTTRGSFPPPHPPRGRGFDPPYHQNWRQVQKPTRANFWWRRWDSNPPTVARRDPRLPIAAGASRGILRRDALLGGAIPSESSPYHPGEFHSPTSPSRPWGRSAISPKLAPSPKTDPRQFLVKTMAFEP